MGICLIKQNQINTQFELSTCEGNTVLFGSFLWYSTGYLQGSLKYFIPDYRWDMRIGGYTDIDIEFGRQVSVGVLNTPFQIVAMRYEFRVVKLPVKCRRVILLAIASLLRQR